MLIGYNNDVEHRGKTFHIQTEDRGANDQLFHGGAILDTKITSYEELVEDLDGELRDEKIKSVMKASHQSLFKNLLAGQYDEQVGLDPIEKSEEELKQDFKEKIQEFQPGQDRVPQAAVELEEEGIEALEEEAAEEGFQDPAKTDHQGLSELKDQLEEMDGEEEADVEDLEIDLGGGDDEPPAEAAVLNRGGKKDEDEDEATVVADTDNVDTASIDADNLDTARLDPDDLDFTDDQNLGEETAGDADPFPEPKDDDPFPEPKTEESFQMNSTGVSAWTGCEEPDEDLSIVGPVEQYLAKS